ncbi:hypothetical protein E2562_016187 [Oryza meyeriana var. granulata]|uniref:Uncharacterized protein n=1 Tax=Oryza meyeriana var. granulata TaxID=110450 RepID=A0A6G1CQA8_9ORYZ|nr:hypothetical protein E2562_016187 [Oryza meyeriana var. granulata]
MDSKQLIPSNSGANRGLASCFLPAGRELCPACFSPSCLGGFSAGFCCCFSPLVFQENRVEYPAAAISAGDELRIEKARILSMIEKLVLH